MRDEPKAVALRQSDLMAVIEDGKAISIDPEEGIKLLVVKLTII